MQRLRETRLAPLRAALNEAIAVHTQATGVREALEAEVCALFERAIEAGGDGAAAAASPADAAASAAAAASGDVDLDRVAAAAMVAVETAVKDEVEAAAVVAATQAAMDKTLLELQRLAGASPAPLPGAAEAAAAQLPALGGLEAAAAAAALAAEDAAVAAVAAAAAADGAVDDVAAAARAAAASASASAALIDALVPAPPAASGAAASLSAGASPAASPASAASAASLASLASMDEGGGASSADALAAAPSAAAAMPTFLPVPQSPEVIAAAAKAKAKGQRQLARALGLALALGGGYAFFAHSALGAQVAAAASSALAAVAERLGPVHIGDAERGLLETIWLLLTSIVCVPLVCKLIPGGSPVLGYLIGGALVGPHALNIIADVHQVQHLAELGVVFLLFNIGLELSLERLQSMARQVFGMGSAQVVLSLLGVAGAAMALAGLPGTSAIILGGALAMSTTAVAIQVLEDRGEMGSRHGRATFSVLLFQDLAVVVLLMLIPLLAPDPSGRPAGAAKIAQALGLAGVKAVVCIVGIIAGGRLVLRPLYKRIAGLANAEIFSATTLLVVLGTSLSTQLAGLSLALGAFLAGLLLAETEYVLQVESDIAPYKGLLMGLFFMTVGMQISVGLFMEQWKTIVVSIVALIAGKLAVMVAAGHAFGLSRVAALRAGLLLASGGEFAFVAFGEAVAKGVLPAELTGVLYMVVALSMALVPYLAMIGAKIGALTESAASASSDPSALQPDQTEVKEMRNHVIIAGYGRVGQLIAQMLSEQLIPFVALDVRSERVAQGRSGDLPVYFGDAGSPAVLHSVGAERAACAVITLDSPGANYRTVWAMHKHFPSVKTYVRAHDVNHGINLERAGAAVVVPETLEPSLQLAASVLGALKIPPEEVTSVVDQFRKKHLSELRALTKEMGTSLGYWAPPGERRGQKAAASMASMDGGGAEAAAAAALAAAAAAAAPAPA